jgi:hypothetical protein
VRLFRLAHSPRDLANNVIGRLSESFAYIAEAVDSDELRRGLLHVADRLRESRVVPPQLGFLYLRIVDAVESGDEPEGLRLCGRLAEILSRPWTLEVAPYSREELGDFYEGFAEVLFDESYGKQPIAEAPEPIWLAARGHFERGLGLIREFDPALFLEIEALWSRIYIGVGNSDSGKSRFGGVTSMVLWGGTFANAEHYNSEIKAAEFLVHEVTHALLFAAGCDEPMVLNPPEEVFPSPLRKDPRPMDGIFHAALVCARVAGFYETLREVNAGLPVDEETLGQCRDANARKFLQGYATIKQFGRLSPLGEDFLEQANACVKALRHGG